MRKKLQVFISSTFTDLQEERQTAVESVLNAGHIPAGMELFKSGDSTQKEVIKKWIDESDVYMLILGGRYGSIDNETGKSYTHWEYDYAGEVGKPRFSVVVHQDALEDKVKEKGFDVAERQHFQKYNDFKEEVLGKVSRFYTDLKDIKITVLESLGEYQNDSNLSGWIAGNEVGNFENYQQENFDLLKENIELKKEIENMKQQIYKKDEIDGSSFEEIVNYMKSKDVTFPEDFVDNSSSNGKTVTLYKAFNQFQNAFAAGISNQKTSNAHTFLYLYVGLPLMSFGLVEKVKVTGTAYEKLQISKAGYKYLKQVKLKGFASKEKERLAELQ